LIADFVLINTKLLILWSLKLLQSKIVNQKSAIIIFLK